MEYAINRFFGLVNPVTERLPLLSNLIVEMAVIGLLLHAVRTIFRGRPQQSDDGVGPSMETRGRLS